jgi:hypothetical protein
MEQAKFEAKTLCSMNHPGVIRAYDWWVVYSERRRATADDASAVHIQLELAKQDLVRNVTNTKTVCINKSHLVDDCTTTTVGSVICSARIASTRWRALSCRVWRASCSLRWCIFTSKTSFIATSSSTMCSSRRSSRSSSSSATSVSPTPPTSASVWPSAGTHLHQGAREHARPSVQPSRQERHLLARRHALLPPPLASIRSARTRCRGQ